MFFVSAPVLCLSRVRAGLKQHTARNLQCEAGGLRQSIGRAGELIILERRSDFCIVVALAAATLIPTSFIASAPQVQGQQSDTRAATISATRPSRSEPRAPSAVHALSITHRRARPRDFPNLPT